VKSGGDAIFIEADISSEKGVTDLVSAAVKHYGRLDGAVNNAGIATVSILIFSGLVSDLVLGRQNLPRTLDREVSRHAADECPGRLLVHESTGDSVAAHTRPTSHHLLDRCHVGESKRIYRKPRIDGWAQRHPLFGILRCYQTCCESPNCTSWPRSLTAFPVLRSLA
jgi:hypothetical protein